MSVGAFEAVEVSDQVRPKVVRKSASARVKVSGPRYVARKPMQMGDRKIKIGDLVPEAAKWPRVEAWVRCGYIELVEG